MRAGTSGLACGDVYPGTGAHVSCHGKRRSAAEHPAPPKQRRHAECLARRRPRRTRPAAVPEPQRRAAHPSLALPGIAAAPISLFCTREAISLTGWERRHIGGYRLSSGTQRKLQSVTGAQWLPTPDRRLGAVDYLGSLLVATPRSSGSGSMLDGYCAVAERSGAAVAAPSRLGLQVSILPNVTTGYGEPRTRRVDH